MPATIHPEDIDLFCGDRTSLADIKAAGWSVYQSSSGNWWYRHETGRRFLPLWIVELVRKSEEQAVENIQSQLRQLLGLKG